MTDNGKLKSDLSNRRDPNPILEQFHKIKKNKFLGHYNSNNVQFESSGSSISKTRNHVPMTLLKERFSFDFFLDKKLNGYRFKIEKPSDAINKYSSL